MTDESNHGRRSMELPDRRKNTYASLERRLDEHLEEIENRFKRWLIRGLAAFAVMGIACTIALVGFGIVLGQIKDTREDFVRSNCESQNEQHDNTSKALIAAAANDIKKAKNHEGTSQGPVSVQEIENRRDVTLALIDALRPKQDCEFLVKLSVGDATPTPVPTIVPPTPTQTP
jgi:hypothetical protein